MLIDGSEKSEINIESMLFWDVNNGIARRNWARNKGAISQISRAMKKNPKLKVTLPNLVDDNLLENI
jgi:urocanate hydratase